MGVVNSGRRWVCVCERGQFSGGSRGCVCVCVRGDNLVGVVEDGYMCERGQSSGGSLQWTRAREIQGDRVFIHK